MKAAPRLFVGAGAAYAGIWLWSRQVLPARVPTQFGDGGQVESWSSRTDAVVTTALLGLGAMVFFAGLVAFTRWAPVSVVHIPHAHHWSQSEHAGRLRELVTEDLWLFGAWSLLLLGAVQVLLVQVAGASRPSVDPWAPILLVIYLFGVLARITWMYLRRYAVAK